VKGGSETSIECSSNHLWSLDIEASTPIDLGIPARNQFSTYEVLLGYEYGDVFASGSISLGARPAGIFRARCVKSQLEPLVYHTCLFHYPDQATNLSLEEV
jgi:hypothetical protein